MVMAALMLCSMPILTAFAESEGAVWLRGKEHFEGGKLTYGTVELRSGSEYVIAEFIYGYGVNASEAVMQTIARSLYTSDFPMLTIPYDSTKPDGQNFLVMSTEDKEAVDALIIRLEQLRENEEEAAEPETEPEEVVVSDSDAAQTATLSEEDFLTLLGIFSQYASSDDGQTVSESDVVSGSDAVSDSDVSASDAEDSDADVSESDVVSGSDADTESAEIELTDAEQEALLNFFDMFGFSGSVETASDSDVVISDAEEPEEEEQEEPEEQPESEAAPDDELSVEVPDDMTESGSLYSLLALREGVCQLRVLPTLEQSLAAAFPEFSFSAAEPTAMNDPVSDNVILAEDGCSAQVLVHPEPEYVDIELNGTVFTVLLMSEKDTSYTVDRVKLSAQAGKVVHTTSEPEQETTTATEAETTTSTTTTTTTTTATTTTTTATTTTTTAATTTTTTTTTAAATTTTAYNSGKVVTGYVSTNSLDLNVRTGPGLGYSSIKLIPKGTVVTVLDRSNKEWYFVRLSDGTEGYVYSYYITLND